GLRAEQPRPHHQGRHRRGQGPGARGAQVARGSAVEGCPARPARGRGAGPHGEDRHAAHRGAGGARSGPRGTEQAGGRAVARSSSTINSSINGGRRDMATNIEEIAEKLDGLTLLEAAQLSKLLQEKWGVSAAAVAVAAPAAGGGAAAA